MDTQRIARIIEEAEHEYYGLRAHRSTIAVGDVLDESYVWVDGERTDGRLDGISTLNVEAGDDVEAVVSRLRDEYCWADETIVLVAGDRGSWGEDIDERIIRDGIVLAIVEG